MSDYQGIVGGFLIGAGAFIVYTGNERRKDLNALEAKIAPAAAELKQLEQSDPASYATITDRITKHNPRSPLAADFPASALRAENVTTLIAGGVCIAGGIALLYDAFSD